MFQTLINNATSPVVGSAINCIGVRRALMYVDGNFAGEIVFEASLNGTSWFPYAGELVGARQPIDRLRSGYRAVFFDVEALYAIRPNLRSIWEGRVSVYGYSEVGKASGFSYSRIASAGGFLVKSGAGVLHGVVVGKPGSSVVLTLYDNTSASSPVIAVISPTAAGSVSMFGVKFSTGLYANITATTMGDLTLVYE